MANIVVYRDPAGVSAPEIYQLNGEVNLADWMLNQLTDNISGLHCQIILNGREIVNSETMTIEQCCKGAAIKVGLFDNVTFRFRPQGIELSTIAILAIVAVGAAVLTIALAPKPRVPGQSKDEGSDNNNQLNSATNSYRPRQAIPDIAGQVVSYPDFIQPSYYEYVDGQRVFNEWFCVGVGRYLFSSDDVKQGDAFLNIQPGSQVTKYSPGDSYPEMSIVKRNPESQDFDLLPSVESVGNVTGVRGQWVVSSSELIIGSVAVKKINPQVGNSLSVNLSGYRYDGPDLITVNVTGSFTVDSSSGGSIFLTTDLDPQDFTVTGGSIVNINFVPAEQYFTLEGDSIDEIWFHLIMPQGIRKGDGTSSTVTATLTAEEIDEFGIPTGVNVFEIGAEFSGSTQQIQRATFKITALDGLVPSRYRVKPVRITDSLGDNALDLLTLEGVDSVTFYTPNFGEITAINVVRSSNQRVSQGASSKVNVLATRQLRIYDNDTGIYGATYETTRRFCDYVFYLLHEKAGVPIAQIYTDELFGIHDNLTDAQLGYFDYTFSDDNIALRERAETACNSARVRYWNEGLLWSFVRDEARPFKSLMFNRRNLTPAASNYAQKFRRPADYDGVTVIYVDPVKNAEKRVSRRIDGSGNIVAGIGIRSLEINLAGCRNDLQALNRCELEVRRLIYQSIKVNDTALNDAQLARIGMRIDWVDMYDSDLFDGELLSVAGNVYTTSERFEPADGVEYWVYVTDDSGQPGNSARAYPRADGNKFGFEADGLTGVYVANGVIQSGSRYFIASNSDSDASTFTVIGRGRPNERGECTIELAEYNELMYEAD